MINLDKFTQEELDSLHNMNFSMNPEDIALMYNMILNRVHAYNTDEDIDFLAKMIFKITFGLGRYRFEGSRITFLNQLRNQYEKVWLKVYNSI